MLKTFTYQYHTNKTDKFSNTFLHNDIHYSNQPTQMTFDNQKNIKDTPRN